MSMGDVSAPDRPMTEAERPRVLLRADASTSIGTGHVVRCLTLGRELLARGWAVDLTGRMPEGLATMVREAGVEPHLMPGDLDVGDEPAWLEAHRLLVAAVVVVDSYRIGRAWHRRVAASGCRVAAIDDLASVRMDVDLLLNQNLGATPERYRKLVPDGARVLVGPRFALVRSEFAAFRSTLPTRTGSVERVLIFLSGADEHDVTGRAADAVLASGLAADVVVGAAYPHLAALEARVAGAARLQVHVNTPRMADLMAAADVAIGAPSSASWERCTLRLPSILVVLADNQVEVGGLLASLGAGQLVGWHHEVDAFDLGLALDRLRADPDRVRAMGIAAGEVTDGLGTRRVADALVELLPPSHAAHLEPVR